MICPYYRTKGKPVDRIQCGRGDAKKSFRGGKESVDKHFKGYCMKTYTECYKYKELEKAW